ncbi:UNVERIFIED_CONTAM: hypothetical protein PYX00_005281 [Menopon gallinae]|uniref:HEAT repeat-containing protein 6 n=1 Tax=Menopon gallinae TaxID=328185 RepID=A0AAW2HRG8_9NEOP
MVQKKRGVLVINQCCYLITPEDENLVLMACDLFSNLLTKQQVSIESRTLSLAVSWCLQCLRYKTNLAVLKCLQVLVKGNNKKIEQQLGAVMNELKKVSNNFKVGVSEDVDSELLLHCLKCIENIVCPSDSEEESDISPDVICGCFEVFREVLVAGKCEVSQQQINHCKCLIASMKGIGNMLELSDHILETYMNDILGIVKGYMLYGLPGDDGYKVQKVLPCQVAVPDIFKHTAETKKLKGKYDKKARKIPVTSITSIEDSEKVISRSDYVGFNDSNAQSDGPNFISFKTSDSDYSEEEVNQNCKIRLQESKVRQCALILLGLTVKKTNPKLFTGYLPNFLPDGSQIPHVRTLITCLLKDSSPNCRAEVVGILSMLISNSKQYFLQGDNASRTSFTTFSGTIGNIIRELHRSLALALIAENSVTVIQRLLKCMSELIRCSSYQKLESGMITRLSKHVSGFLSHKNVNVRIAALCVFGCIVSVGPQIQEIRDIVMKKVADGDKSVLEDVPSGISNGVDELYEDEEDEESAEKSWLFELCLRNITEDSACTNPEFVIESLEVIGALVRNFFRETVVSYPNDIINILQICMKKSDYLVRLYGGKLMETVFSSLQFSLTLEDESLRAPISLVTQLWETLLPGPVTSLVQSGNEPMLRCKGCDCIANVGVVTHSGQQTTTQNSFIFDLLSGKHQILCVTLLFGCALDESPAVRSSAVRALAILVLFPSLMEDSLFFLDATDAAVETARDENNTVRYQSAWLLGNLTESVVQNYEKKLGYDTTQKVLARLLETGIKLSQDSPKIRPGALRAIGNIMRTINEDFTTNNKHSVIEGLNVLMKNATTGTFMKARWNSCYAIANSLKNSIIYKYSESVAKIFTSLISLVQNYKNFKVRISAACALCAPPNRRCYGEHYISVWSAALQALENSKNVCDINEYQHRDHLVDQLCFVMAHLINLVEIDDLVPVQDAVVHHLDNVKHSMLRFQESVLPERGDIILKATARIHNLMDERNLREEHRSAINMIESILVSES